ncbi:Protein DYAD [Linum grandiflorum]
MADNRRSSFPAMRFLVQSPPSPLLLIENSPTYAQDPSEHIRVGGLYEIDHSMLPSRYPDQLKCVRVVMVNEKTRMRVSLRYPSIYSVRDYFSDGGRGCSVAEVKNIPALVEKCMIGSEVAAEALYRRISPAEVAEKKRRWYFWMVPSIDPPKSLSIVKSSKRNRGSSLLSELKTSRIANWGLRRKVRFLSRRAEEEKQEEANYDLTEEEEVKEDAVEENEEQEDGEEGEEDEEEENQTRKRNASSSTIQLRKRPKQERMNQIVVYRQKKKKVLKNSIDRWSAERYKMAEINMLKIMKEEAIGFGNPILRADLRAKARKMIGDTGLLDHLLKHMAGKVAHGGEERFRRRHNAEGSMEYWLEKANLMDIRKEAGVADPYWIPPPGWKPGDNPSQNPVCAAQIKQLKEELEKLRRSIEEQRSKKQEDELAAVTTTPISSVTSFISIEHEGLRIPLQDIFIDLTNKKARIEEQLAEISKSLSDMEETIAATKRSENRALKMERLRSGFRIYNPGNSNFLLPSIYNHRYTTTPPSASSSSTVVFPPPVQYSSSPPVMRPFAERRALTINVRPSILASPGSRTPVINLDEEPGSSQNDTVLTSTRSHGHVSSCPVTYQRRNHHSLTASNSSTLAAANGPNERGRRRNCSSSLSMGASSSLPAGVQTWMAVGEQNQSPDKASDRG